jgi:hypothetical protein
VTGTQTCSNAFFGQDPAPNVVKACYTVAGTTTTTTPTTPTVSAPSSGTRLAGENEAFTVAGATLVQYGAGSSWTQANVTGSATCSNAFFGQDPAPNVVKACYSLGAASTTTPPTTTPTTPIIPTGPAVGSDIVDAGLNIVPASYTAMAAQLSKDAGLAYRYGPDAASYGVGNGGLPTLAKRADNATRCGTGTCLSFWQVGGPRNPGDDNPGASQAAAGLYSTNQANVLFVADDPSQRVGVADIQISAHEYNTFAQLPQLSWTIALAPGGGIDSMGTLDYKAKGLVSGDPVAIGRCGGRAGFCATSVVAYQNGLLGTSGTNTASNKVTAKLPANKVPTAIAMTGISEFALVTVWDTTALKGQIAVVSLAGLCEGCDVNTSKGIGGWGDWIGGLYPGLPSLGDIGFMKILGYVDLPGMAAPTEIAVTTGMDQFQSMLVGGTFVGHATSLTNESDRQSFNGSGSNANRYAKGGVAVVISKSEQKVAFVDLKPLFAYLNSVYFGGSQSSFSSTVNNLGQADSQWPHSFAYKPEQTPTVIKTVALGARPTAVRTTMSGSTQRAWIATQDGTLHIYGLGNYTSGSGAEGDIVERGSVAVGRNPTSLAISKGEPDASIDTINQQVLVTARGDRKLQWVRFAGDGNSGSVVRTLQDTRMIDPVAAEDADNFATVGNVTSVADYGGKAVSNYRYGPVIFAESGGNWACQGSSGGCPVNATGAMKIEFGGSMPMPGKVFQLSTANVP